MSDVEQPQKRSRQPSRKAATAVAGSGTPPLVPGQSSRKQQPAKKAAGRKPSKARQALPGARRGGSSAPSSYANARISDEGLAALVDEHRQSQRPNTTSTYQTALNKWERFLNYDEEGNERDPPLSGQLTDEGGPDHAVLFLDWLERNMPGWEYKNKAPKLSPAVLDACCSALQALYEEQQNKLRWDTIKKLRQYGPFSLKYATIKNNLQGKGQRATGKQDSQDGTGEDTLSLEQLLSLASYFLAKGSCDMDRNLAMCLFAYTTVMRGDDLRLLFLADLIRPTKMTCIGPAPAFLLSAVIRGGKTMENGKLGYAGCIRHQLALLCAHGALARMLCHRFTIEGEPFPSLLTPEAWHILSLWRGLGAGNIGYEAQNKALAAAFAACGIIIKKSTHAFRVLAARVMDEAGIDDTTIHRLGRWLKDALYKSYLRFFKPDGLLSLAGWPQAVQKRFERAFWTERFMVCVCEELVTVVFPFLPRLRQELQQLGAAATASMRSIVEVLQYLGVVLVQDALDLTSGLVGGDIHVYKSHPVHKLLLAHPLFQELQAWYLAGRRLGNFEPYRPRTTQEDLRDLKQMVMRVMYSQGTSTSTQPAATALAPAAYSGVGDPSAATLVTPADLEAVQQQQLDEVLAAADGAAVDGEGDQAEEQQQTPNPGRAVAGPSNQRSLPHLHMAGGQDLVASADSPVAVAEDGLDEEEQQQRQQPRAGQEQQHPQQEVTAVQQQQQQQQQQSLARQQQQPPDQRVAALPQQQHQQTGAQQAMQPPSVAPEYHHPIAQQQQQGVPWVPVPQLQSGMLPGVIQQMPAVYMARADPQQWQQFGQQHQQWQQAAPPGQGARLVPSSYMPVMDPPLPFAAPAPMSAASPFAFLMPNTMAYPAAAASMAGMQAPQQQLAPITNGFLGAAVQHAPFGAPGSAQPMGARIAEAYAALVGQGCPPDIAAQAAVALDLPPQLQAQRQQQQQPAACPSSAAAAIAEAAGHVVSSTRAVGKRGKQKQQEGAPPARPAPSHSKFASLEQLYDLWDKGLTDYPPLKDLEGDGSDPSWRAGWGSWWCEYRGFLEAARARASKEKFANERAAVRVMEQERLERKITVANYVKLAAYRDPPRSNKGYIMSADGTLEPAPVDAVPLGRSAKRTAEAAAATDATDAEAAADVVEGAAAAAAAAAAAGAEGALEDQGAGDEHGQQQGRARASGSRQQAASSRQQGGRSQRRRIQQQLQGDEAEEEEAEEGEGEQQQQQGACGVGAAGRTIARGDSSHASQDGSPRHLGAAGDAERGLHGAQGRGGALRRPAAGTAISGARRYGIRPELTNGGGSMMATLLYDTEGINAFQAAPEARQNPERVSGEDYDTCCADLLTQGRGLCASNLNAI